jgi:hypothetical protein
MQIALIEQHTTRPFSTQPTSFRNLPCQQPLSTIDPPSNYRQRIMEFTLRRCLVFLFSLLFCSVGIPAAPAAHFKLIYSNDLRGETAPCGT